MRQYTALLAHGGGRAGVQGGRDASDRASIAARVNERTDDIGARRLYTVMEKLLEDLSFDAPDLAGARQVVDAAFVRERLEPLVARRGPLALHPVGCTQKGSGA